MNHKEASELLPAHLDQQLGVADAIAVEQHLVVSARLKRHAPYFKAPSGLAQRLRMSLPPENSPSNRFRRPGFAWLPGAAESRSWSFNWLNLGAVAASLLALVVSAKLYFALPSDQERLTEDLISSHVRSLQVDHLSDVASTDKHTVKPWFNGKLDFSPPVLDLAAQDFPLEGGRLDYVDGRAVAVLIYRRAKHPINLYIWPTSDRDAPPQAQDRHGYHLVRWTSGGMKYSAVSDLATDELEVFAGILRSQ